MTPSLDPLPATTEEDQAEPSLVVGASIIAAYIAGEAEMLQAYMATFGERACLTSVIKAAGVLIRARARTSNTTPQQAADRLVAAAIAAQRNSHPAGSQS